MLCCRLKKDGGIRGGKMFFDPIVLFFVSGIIYFLILLVKFLKHNVTFMNQLAFTGIYGSSVLWLSIYCFPFSTNSINYRAGWSFIPFYNLFMVLNSGNEASKHILHSLCRYFLISFLLALIISVCFALHTMKPKLITTLFRSTILIFVLQILGIWCMVYGHVGDEHAFDTGVLVVDIIGVLIGFVIYKLLNKIIEGKKIV